MRRLIALLLAVSVVACAAATSASARLLPRSAQPMEMSYELWLAKWTKAAFQRHLLAPTSLLTAGASRCGFPFGKVWMLPASIDGTVDLHCRVPAGKVLLVVVGGLTAVRYPYTEEEYQADLAEYVPKWVKDPSLSMDGHALRPGYLIQTAELVLDLPRNNVFGEPIGLATAASRGYVALLSPPSRGEHVIATAATYPSGTFGITYTLTIE